MTNTEAQVESTIGYRIAARTAVVTGVFSLLVCTLLLYDYTQRRMKDPFEAPAFLALKAAVSQQPDIKPLKRQIASLREEIQAIEQQVKTPAKQPSEELTEALENQIAVHKVQVALLENQVAAIEKQSAVLKEQLEGLDKALRTEYVRHRDFAWFGGLLLAGGVTVFVIAGKAAATLRRRLPMPEPGAAPQDMESRWKPIARWCVGGLIVLAACVTIGLSLRLRSPLAEDLKEMAAGAGKTESQAESSMASERTTARQRPEPAPKEKSTPSAIAPTAKPTDAAPKPTPKQPEVHPKPKEPDVAKPKPPAVIATGYTPSEEEVRNAWPRFRGPNGSGISRYTNVPDAWDGPSGKNILWKTPVPMPGNNSPVVCGKRVFLSGADEKIHQVYCFDTADGKLLWQQDVPITPQGTPTADKELTVNGDTGYAASTTTTDGKRVYAIFVNGDVAAFDYDGKPAWSLGLGVPKNGYGHAASLLVYRDLLLVPMDQGSGKDGKSKLLALDGATGKTVWQQTRQVPSSWTTPIVISHAGRDQIITVANPWVIAHDPKDGKEIWRAKGLSGDVAPSPVFADGVVYAAANESAPLMAIRADGQGDVTATHILWKGEDNVPDTCSPLAAGQYVFVTSASGIMTCYDAKKGDMLWDKDFGKLKLKSSPSMVGNRLYLISDNGKGVILEPAKDGCKQVSEADLGEPCVTSPAFQDGRIYLRGAKHLFCIGKK